MGERTENVRDGRIGETMEGLAQVISSRRGASPEESYTARLLYGPEDSLLKKLTEEATEVVMACKDEHCGWDTTVSKAQPHMGQFWMNIKEWERGDNERHIKTATVPTPCSHCETPACVKAAKDGAACVHTMPAASRKQQPSRIIFPTIPYSLRQRLPRDSRRNNRGHKSGIIREGPGYTGKTLCNFIA